MNNFAVFIIVIVFALCGHLVKADSVAAWGKCGGIGYSGPTSCGAGYTCVFDNDYYSQCKPCSGPCPGAPLPTVPQSDPWGQCGGNGWTGATACTAGYSCVYSSEWYSQCKPAPAATTSTPVASPTASPTAVPVASPTAAPSTPYVAPEWTDDDGVTDVVGNTDPLFTQEPFGLCEGVDLTIPVQCPEGYVCLYSNPYGSHCKPCNGPCPAYVPYPSISSLNFATTKLVPKADSVLSRKHQAPVNVLAAAPAPMKMEAVAAPAPMQMEAEARRLRGSQ